MKCPRCQARIVAGPDQPSTIVCPSCGARLRSRPASGGPASRAEVEAVVASIGPAAPDTRRSQVPSPKRGAAASAAAPAAAPPLREQATLETILAELRALRSVQEEMLEMLREPAPTATQPARGNAAFDEAAPPRAVRARRHKTVLLIDDDPSSRQEAIAALEAAEVPVQSVEDGKAGLAAIAKEKPDVIVMELGIGGAMAGKDVVNMIKATMEWVNIPIVLYTRVAIENPREARQIHGADELVQKGPGAADTLVSRVVALFRRG